MYYDLKTFPDSETRRALARAGSKKYGPGYGGAASGKRSGSSSKSGTPEARDAKRARK